MNFREASLQYEAGAFRRHSREIEDMDDDRSPEEIEADTLKAEEAAERRCRRHPGDFYGRPSNEQMEYFKRGGR